MDILYPRCAGLDVHKESVTARVRCVSPPSHDEVRTFATTTTGLLDLADWLGQHGCTHVAMETTGVYWRPVWHVLEDRFQLVLANAQHVRNAGPKAGLHVHFYSRPELCERLARAFVVVAEPREKVIVRAVPATGVWTQWETIWRRREEVAVAIDGTSS